VQMLQSTTPPTTSRAGNIHRMQWHVQRLHTAQKRQTYQLHRRYRVADHLARAMVTATAATALRLPSTQFLDEGYTRHIARVSRTESCRRVRR
jgi:hypothetical protein